MVEKKKRERDDEQMTSFTEAGDIGDEQLPAGEIKTDKREWNYQANKVKHKKPPKEIEDFAAGL